MNELISCIVPAFNSAQYIGEALDSIFAQTYPEIEVIVVDDGSTDGTRDLVCKYHHVAIDRSQLGDESTAGTREKTRADPRKIRLLEGDNAGPAETRNWGVLAAQGDYLAFLDADDLWVPEKLTRQMARFTADPALELCLSHAQMFWPEHLNEEAQKYQDHQRSGAIPGYATTTLLAKRGVFDRIGMFDPQYWFGDATDWLMRAREGGLKLEMVSEVLTLHRMHEFNLTRRRSQASRDEFLEIVKAALNRRRGGGK